MSPKLTSATLVTDTRGPAAFPIVTADGARRHRSCAETSPERAMTVRVGLSAYDITATELVHLAAAADDAGFESLWLGEHIVLPIDYGSEHPTTGDTAHQHHTGPIVDPSTKLLDPLVALAACAASPPTCDWPPGSSSFPSVTRC